MKKSLIIIVIVIIMIGLLVIGFINDSTPLNNSQNNNSNEPKTTKGEEKETMKVNIIMNGANYTATLEDNETVKELINKLPLEITMDELNGNEKYYYMNTSLPTDSKRVGKIKTGDIMLYGSDCLVIFYEDFTTPYSYTKIGKIDNPDSLKDTIGKSSVKVTIKK